MRGNPTQRLLAAVLGFALVANLEAADLSAGAELSKRLGCPSCHGETGMGVNEETPNLAGQDPSYLIRQLKVFAEPQGQARANNGESERHHSGMEASTRNLSYTEIESLADYYASLSCVPEPDRDARAMPKAAQPCVRCHGAYGINIEPGVPNLAGQKSEYLSKQLQAFRASFLGTDPFQAGEERYHEMMAKHAFSLTDDDIDRIAGYFAGLACR